jgi:hypothetical protein
MKSLQLSNFSLSDAELGGVRVNPIAAGPAYTGIQQANRRSI